ncbi:MAG: DUF4292 domain-containing protein [Desulfatitalea sp.]
MNNCAVPVGSKIRSILFCLLCLLQAAATLNGCAWRIKPPEDDADARQWLSRWTGQNTELKQFKGLMRVQIQAEGQTLNGRAALAAAVPDRVRVELLNMLGQPITSLAGNGTVISLHAINEGQFYSWDQSGTSLERFIHIPLGIEALLEILSGRPPLPDHVAAQVPTSATGGCAVVLKNRRDDIVADLRSDGCDRIQTLKVFNSEGALRYEVRWLAWQEIAGYTLPRTVQMLSGQGNQITWNVERFWSDVTLPPATFILEGAQNP